MAFDIAAFGDFRNAQAVEEFYYDSDENLLNEEAECYEDDFDDLE